MIPLLKLRRLTPETAEAAGKVNSDIYEVCLLLLRDNNYFVNEEAIERAGHLRNRHLVQWPAIKKALEMHYECPLLSVSRKDFRDLTSNKYQQKLRMLSSVKKKIEKGNGHETAGYGFPSWGEDKFITKRHITTRRHSAIGFDAAADLIEQSGAPVIAPPPQTPEVPTEE